MLVFFCVGGQSFCRRAKEEGCQRVTEICRIFELQISNDFRGLSLLRCDAVGAITSRLAIKETMSHAKRLAHDRMQGRVPISIGYQ